MTFTPVSNISIEVDCSSNAGAWRWMEHAAQGFAANGHGDGSAKVDGLHTAHHAFGRLHSDAAHAAFTQLLLHFQDDVDGRGHVETITGDAQRRVDGRQRRRGKLHVHRGTCDLNNVSDVFCHMNSALRSKLSAVGYQPSARNLACDRYNARPPWLKADS
jgi:hypothetical protein